MAANETVKRVRSAVLHAIALTQLALNAARAQTIQRQGPGRSEGEGHAGLEPGSPLFMLDPGQTISPGYSVLGITWTWTLARP